MVASAATAENPHLERRGSSVRAGADVRFRFSEAVTASASFDHLTGEVVQSSKFFGVGGYRAGLVIEVFP